MHWNLLPREPHFFEAFVTTMRTLAAGRVGRRAEDQRPVIMISA